MNFRPRPRIKRLSRGGYALNLPADERALLRELPRQLIEGLELAESGEAVADGIKRILPTANPTNPDQEAGYIGRHRAGLLAQHMEALDVVASTASSTHISDEELDAWLKWLQEKGVEVNDFYWPSGSRSLYFSDPAGNSLELTSPSTWGLS